MSMIVANATRPDYLSKSSNRRRALTTKKIFSLVVKMSIIRLVLGMVASENLHLEWLDMKMTFLHGD